MEVYMLKSKTLGCVAVMLGVAVASAQADDLGAIQKKLASEYAVTQPTADNTDIVTAGSILILQKSGLMLSPTTNTTLDQNTYRDGTIQAGAATKTKSFLHKFGSVPGISSVPGVGTVAGTAATADSSSGGASRTYVTGEKIWVTKVEVKTEGKDQEAVFTLFTDAVSDVRYRGTLKIVFPKGSSDDQVDKVVAEVFKIQPADDQKADAAKPAAPAAPAAGGAQQAAVPAVAAPAAPAPAAALPDIAPPPPPVDQPAPPPVTVSLGQTPDQVIAALGQPQKIIKLAKKETYYYKDLKVIFTAGKVSDVE
jgi:hypothetical protein